MRYEVPKIDVMELNVQDIICESPFITGGGSGIGGSTNNGSWTGSTGTGE